MTAADIIQRLRAAGASLAVEGDRLQIEAPPGVMTPDLQSAIRECKADILRQLRSEPSDGSTPLPRTNDEDTFPLALAQERIWLFQQLEPASTAYLLTQVLRIEGPFDLTALASALRTVVERHETLRCVITTEDERALNRCASIPASLFELRDLSHLTPEDARAAWGTFVREQQARPFDLSHELPLRVFVVRGNETRHELLLVLHHVAIDGLSLQILVRDLIAAYGGETLPPLPARYRDYAAWERRRWESDQSAELAFWRNYLVDAPPVTELPADRSRGATATYSGGFVLNTIAGETLRRLQDISRRENASLFMILAAALAAALHRHNGQRDLVIGTPVSGRNHPDAENVVGMFVNQIALRLRVAPETTLRALVREARGASLDAFSHQSVPFGRVLEALNIPRDLSRTPLFQVLLNVLPALTVEQDSVSSGNTRWSLPPASELASLFDAQAKFDLTLYARPQAEKLEFGLVFNRDLFEEERVKDLLDLVCAILDQGSALPDAALDGLFAPATPRLVPAPVDAPPRSVPEWLRACAQRHPTRKAVSSAQVTLTYAQLSEAADDVAHRLQSAAIRPGPVGVFVPHDVRVVPAILGALTSGRPYVPLDPRYPRERLTYMAEDSKLAAVLSVPDLIDRVRDMFGPEVAVVDLEAKASVAAGPLSLPAPDAVAYHLYTSGSTGRPKAVVQSHANLLHQGRRYADALDLHPEDRLALTASISFDASLMDIFGALQAGACIEPVDMRAVGVASLPSLVQQRGLTVLHVTPTVFRTLARVAATAEFPTIRLVVLGGEAVRLDEIQFFDACFPASARLFNLYGASEHSFSFGSFVPRDHRSIEIPIGLPVGDVEGVMLAPDGRIDPVSGELAIRSIQGARGYWNAPEANARAFIPDPAHPGRTLYRTGDVVRRRPDGAYVFLHRADNQVKVRGHRIEPVEIESTLRQHAAVAEVAVHAPLDADGNHELTACVVLKAGSADRAATLAAWCRERLPEYLVPSQWVMLEQLPRTPSGKIDRRNLPKAAPEAAPSDLDAAPQTPTEELIAGIFADVLGRSTVSRLDNFFDLGGHSLRGAQVIARLRSQLRIDLPFRALFEAPTPAALATHAERLRSTTTGVQAPPLVPRAPGGIVPLSFAQERLWFLYELAPESSAYNLAGALELRGHLQSTTLRQALETIVERHEALRTTFARVDENPAQIVSSARWDGFSEVDLAGRSIDELGELLRDEVARPFILQQGPLLRARLYRLGPEWNVLLVTAHHIISDGWSMGVFIRELGAIYNALAGGTQPLLPSPPVQYADFATWQRKWLDGEALQRQLAYWREALSGAPAHLDLPTDFPRPPVVTYRGNRYSFVLPVELQNAATVFSRREGVTLFMTLLAAFQVLLSRHSGQGDVLVGTPVANRGHPEVERLIGFFVNTLVLRARLTPDATGRDVLAQVRETCLGAYAHQEVPFEKLVEELRPRRDLSRNPVFQTMFVLQNNEIPAIDLHGLTVRPMDLDRKASQLDLTLFLRETPEGLHGMVEYATDLFAPETIARFARQFEVLLRGILTAPDAAIASIRLHDEAERRALIEAGNDTRRAYPQGTTVIDLLQQQVAVAGARPAITMGGRSLTYSELNTESDRLADRLQDVGVRPGSLVGICLERRPRLLVAVLAVLKAGAAYVPLDPGFPADRLLFMARDSAATVVLTSSDLATRIFAGTDIRTFCLDDETVPAATAAGDAPGRHLARPDHRAYVLYTSGSTGRPKGVEIEHRALTNFLCSMAEAPGLTADDVLLAVTTLSFDIAGLELFLPLITGARIELADRETALDGAALARAIEASGATVMQATPATWRLLFESGWTGRRGLKVLVGGEALGRDLATRLLPAVGEVWNMYGPTETTIWSSIERILSADDISIGRPIANTQMYVLDAHREPVPQGIVGELWIGGDGVARGYLNRAELTAERFVDNPFHPGRMYRTGDLARRRADGRLDCLGRIDAQVKVRGYRIELGEIEAVLGEHPEVVECAVVARELDGDARLVAYFSGGASAATLRAHLGGRLPEYMVPTLYVPLKSLPKTPNLKIDRNALPAPETGAAAPAADAAFVPPEGDIEPMIAAAFAEVLGVGRVGRDHDFFQLGGHSLLAARLISRLRERLSVELPLRVLFEWPTVRGLSEYIGTVRWAQSDVPAEAPDDAEERVDLEI